MWCCLCYAYLNMSKVDEMRLSVRRTHIHNRFNLMKNKQQQTNIKQIKNEEMENDRKSYLVINLKTFTLQSINTNTHSTNTSASLSQWDICAGKVSNARKLTNRHGFGL